MKLIFSIIFLWQSISLIAQAKLNVVYQISSETTNPSTDLTDKFYTLNLTKEASEYFISKKIVNDDGKEEYLYENYIYKNLEENIIISDFVKQEQANLPQLNWQLQPNLSKKILGYPVKKAILEITPNTSIVAWYTPNLPFNNGPDIYHGLPGLILEIEPLQASDDGEVSTTKITAVSIDMSKNTKPILKPGSY